MFTALNASLSFVPFIGWLWRRLLERNMEVRIQGLFGKDDPHYSVEPGSEASAIFDIELVNHRTDRIERIERGFITIEARRWRFWKKELIRFPLVEHENKLVDNVVLEPQSAPKRLNIFTYGSLRDDPRLSWPLFPKRTGLYVILEMVGPLRRVTRRLETFDHDPKASSER